MLVCVTEINKEKAFVKIYLKKVASLLNILQFAQLMQPPGKVQLWPDSFLTNPRNNSFSLRHDFNKIPISSHLVHKDIKVNPSWPRLNPIRCNGPKTLSRQRRGGTTVTPNHYNTINTMQRRCIKGGCKKERFNEEKCNKERCNGIANAEKIKKRRTPLLKTCSVEHVFWEDWS